MHHQVSQKAHLHLPSPTLPTMDDTVKLLLRFVARGLYSQPYVLILDAVMLHSVLSEDDLIYLLGIQRKELRALCNRLVEDRLLVNHIQKEENLQQRLTTKTYYYIHITETIDAIKWKVHSIVNLLKDEMKHYGNPQGYVCPICGKKVSQLDAIALLSDDRSSFVCDTCGGVLVEDDSSQQATLKQEKLERLMKQVDPIITYLKRIDESYIEDNTFELALMKTIPAQSATLASYAISSRISNRSRSNLANNSLAAAAARSQATLHVSISANDENYEREQMEKEERRQKLEQNALPSWYSLSSVGKSIIGRLDDEDSAIATGSEDNLSREMTPGIKSEADELLDRGDLATPMPQEPAAIPEGTGSATELKDREQQEALAAYYAQLDRQAKEEEEEEEDDEDDDNFDDFDDLDLS